jgi:hypothetical protein
LIDLITTNKKVELLVFYLRIKQFQRFRPLRFDPTAGSPIPTLPMASSSATMNALGTMSIKGVKPTRKGFAISPSAQALKEAYIIHRTFIVPGSPYELNLASKVKIEINTRLKRATTAVAAQRQHQLMSHPSSLMSSPLSSPNGQLVARSPNLIPNQHTAGGVKIGSDDNSYEAEMLLFQSILKIFDDAIAQGKITHRPQSLLGCASHFVFFKTIVLELMQQNHYQRFRTSPLVRHLPFLAMCLLISMHLID